MVMNSCIRPRSESTSTTRVRTLVVDDSPIMLKLLAQILQAAGNFELVGTATDGVQALRYVRALSPELVLMDVHMPHSNGIQAARHLKESKHPPVVILISSDDSPATNSLAKQAGADAFVLKSGNLSLRLTHTLQNLFGPSGSRGAAAGATPLQAPSPRRTTQEHGV